jgi:hypothetical protein
MRAHTKGKHEMGKRFAIVIGVAAAGVMALGAQTALAGGDPVDSTPPDLQLSGPKKQNPQNDGPICDQGKCDVKVRVRCDEECTALVKGKLTKVNRDKLRPDGPYTPETPGEKFHWNQAGGPELASEAQRREVRKALDNGKNVQAKITVKATDAAGNVATAKRTVKLVK